MTSKLTLKLLKLSESDFKVSEDPKIAEKSSSKCVSTKRKRTKDIASATEESALNTKDVLNWHIQTMLQTDHRISTNTPDDHVGTISKTPNAIKSLKKLHQTQYYETAKRKYRSIENRTVGSSRSASAQANIQHKPTFNKHKFKKEKKAASLAKLAKKLQKLDKVKKKTNTKSKK